VQVGFCRKYGWRDDRSSARNDITIVFDITVSSGDAHGISMLLFAIRLLLPGWKRESEAVSRYVTCDRAATRLRVGCLEIGTLEYNPLLHLSSPGAVHAAASHSNGGGTVV